jgi:two-component system sensor histidine kinase/response regulator
VSASPRPESPLAAGAARTSVSSELLHDLRSPLNHIIGYSEMLTEEADGQRREGFAIDLEKIRAAGQRMLALIEENFTSAVETLPALIARESEAPVQSDGAVPGIADVRGHLLVVDDDAANREVLCRRLERQGHDVVTVSSGLDAMRILSETAFDLVLLDIMMPEMDGYEVLGRIKSDSALQHIPVIMVSALNELQSVVRCVEAGAEDYLTKPFNATLLKARIGACLEKKRGRDRESALFEQLQNNYKRLQELEQQRDDMRNMIVHDLRTPLTALMIGVEMLEMDDTMSGSQQEITGIAARGGRTLLGMINDLLDVEKMESGSAQLQYDEVTPAALVAGAVTQVSLLAEESHTTLLTNVAANLRPFSGDGKKLSRTLVNLIANAIKFTGAGAVTVSARQDDPETIHFAVRDTGQGIPAESFGRIFEKFGQLDSRRVGTGLGLAFCKLAVEAHGGRITVESTPGEGSTFSFTIPVRGR